MDEAAGSEYLHSYAGTRRFADYNTCGQAAVAALLDYHALDPFGLRKTVHDARDGRYHWPDDRVIDRVKETFPPDNLFGLFGTTGDTIAEALAHAGLHARVASSADLQRGRGIWESAKQHANAGNPVVAIVDRGKLGGRPFTAHWVVVHKVAGSRVYLANYRKGTTTVVVPEATFVRAFRCRFAPAVFGLNHCAVFAWQAGDVPPMQDL